MKPQTRLRISIVINIMLMVALVCMLIYRHIESHYDQGFAGMLMRRVVLAIEDGRGAEAAKVLKGLPSKPMREDLITAIKQLPVR